MIYIQHYQDYMSVTVNGHRVRIEKYEGVFLIFTVGSEADTISVTYKTSEMTVGVIASIVGIAMITTLFVLQRNDGQAMLKIAFICVHNSCRSQIAEALGKYYLGDRFECYSAGTETKDRINQDAVRLLKELYGIDMEASGQYSKLISDIPDPDILISMGCNVGCPYVGRPFDDDWGLIDPTGMSDEAFIKVIREIDSRINALKDSSKG